MAEQKAGAGSVGVRTNFHFQFITTPTSDTPGTTLLLHFNQKRYIIGEVTEGTQRACIQRGIGLRKVRGLFLAGKTHWNNGGLIGMILSMADVQQSELDDDGVKRPRLNIYAGPMQLHSLACARRFVFRTGMPLSVHEVDVRKNKTDLGPIHEDENIRVWALTTKGGSVTDDVAVDTSQWETEQELRKNVVNNMFDSHWRRDQLFHSKLKDVKLPAIVYVRDPETKTLLNYQVFDINSTPLDPDTDVLHRNPWPASTVEELPPVSGLPRNVAMSYVIKGHPQRGSFDVQRAKARGLKPGPKFRKLAAGESVESDDGTGAIITPDMVLSPTRPSRGLALFDIPSLDHLDDLVRQLSDRTDDLLEGVEAAVWMTRDEVLRAHQFQDILQRLPDMKHIVSDASLSNDNLTHDSSALSSGRLVQVAPSLFSVPRFDNSKAYRPVFDNAAAEVRTLFEDPRILPARRGLRVEVEPNFAIDESEIASNLTIDSFATSLEPEVVQSLPAASPLLQAPDSDFVSGGDLTEPEIITLGTGSAAPSKYRNVSAVLLRMPNGMGNYLFDCGEGTLGQLKRVYSADQLNEILFSLRAIWISHLHADHHLGTVSILQAVYKTRRLAGQGRSRPSPPYLLSEINMIDYMNEYQSVLGIPTEDLCTPIACDPFEGISHQGKSFDIGQHDDHIKTWRTVKVSHCHGAQAVSVTFKNGFKFSYSGDCRPSEYFCEIGADSDVLVHEATFDDGMEGDAMAKKHSTTGEAVGVALGMGAKNLILTHFSQRYQKMPVFSSVKMPERDSEEDILDDVDAEMIHGTNNLDHNDLDLAPTTSSSSWVEPDAARELPIAVAFDLMRIKVSQIEEMKKLFPAISKMFELDEEKREKARHDIAEQTKLEDEKRRLARVEAMAKNAKKKDLQKRERQMEVNAEKGKKSKRNKRKNNGREVNGVAQAQNQAAASPMGLDQEVATTSDQSMVTTTLEPDRDSVNGVEDGERSAADDNKPATIAPIEQGPTPGDGDEELVSWSPLKKRRTG
ncbi:hypothetical protein H2200_000021 [Cladophialophora chaetospira]|uniref:ribonuclease Z n=1 Tax=Cladophialophora chaetospira TaxID=386627 RepID=A0AA38XMM5_9EURO|nr:hypothetical protein H2200_000021 [Cladophialophora chaetospira]